MSKKPGMIFGSSSTPRRMIMIKKSSCHMRRALLATSAALTASVLALAAPSGAQERPPVAQQMSKTYGLESFGQIEKIRSATKAKIKTANR